MKSETGLTVVYVLICSLKKGQGLHRFSCCLSVVLELEIRAHPKNVRVVLS